MKGTLLQFYSNIDENGTMELAKLQNIGVVNNHEAN